MTKAGLTARTSAAEPHIRRVILMDSKAQIEQLNEIAERAKADKLERARAILKAYRDADDKTALERIIRAGRAIDGRDTNNK